MITAKLERLEENKMNKMKNLKLLEMKFRLREELEE